MKCKIVGQNLKVFCKAIRVFSRLSTEVLISVDKTAMKLQSINDNKTAFVEIVFGLDFFSSFECLVDIKCKLLLKSLILVFRVLNIDKIVDNCTVIMEEAMPRVVFNMKCMNGVSREYFVPYMESTSLHYNSTLNTQNPSFKVQSKQMIECLHNFSNETKDVSLWLNSQQILFKTYVDDIEEQNLMTSFAYKARSFQNYSIDNEISVTFDVKDLKTFLEFTSFRDQTIECFFQSSGKPIEFRMDSIDHYSAKLILATHDFPDELIPMPPSLNQTSHNSSSHQVSSIEASAPSASLPAIPIENPLIQMTGEEDDELPNRTSIQETEFTNSDDEQNEADILFEEIVARLPHYSGGIAPFPIRHINSLSQIRQFHESVIYGGDDDDLDQAYSQGILVPASDSEGE